MAQVFAGFVVGYALALLAGGGGAVWLVYSNPRSEIAQRIAPPGTSVVALAVVIHFAAIIVLTALGLVFGMALAGIEDRRSQSGLGSPSVIYTLLVIALTAVLVIPTLALPAVRRVAVAAGLVFLIAFGYAVPWLAKLG